MNQKGISFLLASAILFSLAACQPSADPAPSAQDAGSSQYILVSDAEPSATASYAGESPAISDTAALSGAPAAQQTAVSSSSAEEVRAVWVSYLEMDRLLKNKSKAQFTKNFAAVLDNVQSLKLNTVIVQVRPFGDALYASDYFPWSYTITGTEGKNPGFDPLEIMTREAKARDLRIEAWVNPYRVRAKDNNNALSSGNQAKQWLDAGNSAVVKYNGSISYNPANKEAQTLIVNGVAEIVRKYDVDGVHIDDYFYPTTDAAFDQSSYAAYKRTGGTLALAPWRRSHVETLIQSIYAAVKAENPDCLFGVSPQSSVDNNYNQQYLDVKKITGNSGYCDYVCPQIYFGYRNAAQPYKETLKQWEEMVRGSGVKLYVGLGAYKIGQADTWAGSGKNEWVSSTDLMKNMLLDARSATGYAGFVLYRYDSIFSSDQTVKSAVQKETANLKTIL